MNYPEVSIIILNWNGLEDTIECLESLKNIVYPEYTIILVDNGSANNESEKLKSLFGDYIDLIQNDKNYGFAKGNNIGIKRALDQYSPDYILLLNNDIIVHPRFLNELISVAVRKSEIGIVGPKTYWYSEPSRLQFTTARVNLWTGTVTVPFAGQLDNEQQNDVEETDYCLGACFLIKYPVIKRIGLLKEKYFTYWEETDYCIRARKAGFTCIYCPEAKIWHKNDNSFNSERTIYYYSRNRLLFVRENASKAQKCSFFLFYFLFDLWRTIAYILLKKRNLLFLIKYLQGIKDGIT